MNLDNFFSAKGIAIVGVSKNASKVGHVLLRNLLEGGFKGKIYPVNPKLKSLLGLKVYKSVKDIKSKVELAVIAVPAELVLKVVMECNKKKIKDVLIVTAGFKEIGKGSREAELKHYLELNDMKCIGVNCLGVLDLHNNMDLIFLPRSRMKRPKAGNISFITQSGAVGSAIFDLAASNGYRFSKFISYGNGTVVDEADALEYLAKDKTTEVICLYIEGVQEGERFFNVLKEVSKKKPVIIVKGGVSERGSKAAMSHTGSLAGSSEVFFGVVKQAGGILAKSLEEMLYYASTFSKVRKIKGGRVVVITNGGGYGIMTTDAVINSGNLEMAEFNEKIKLELKNNIDNELVSVENPVDVVGDADTERYRKALDACIKDSNVDTVLMIVLYQTPRITTDIVDVISEYNSLGVKPIFVISTGGMFTKVLRESLEENGVVTFSFPEHAVAALSKLVEFCD
jgi:acetate---CoA ligase (ADP-forming)